eukprot:748319-Hanusia_phi.AAC.7
MNTAEVFDTRGGALMEEDMLDAFSRRSFRSQVAQERIRGISQASRFVPQSSRSLVLVLRRAGMKLAVSSRRGRGWVLLPRPVASPHAFAGIAAGEGFVWVAGGYDGFKRLKSVERLR